VKSPIRILLVDDEPLARQGLRVRLDREEDLEVIGEAEDGPEAATAIRDLRPDLVFLDVQMPGCDGFEVIARVARDHLPRIVFVTAHDQYALKAFSVHAVDYLLKPITHRRLQETLRRVRERYLHEPAEDAVERIRKLLDARIATTHASPHAHRFTVRDGQRFVLVRATEIDWIEAAANYAVLHAAGRRYEYRATMNDLERQLDPVRFVRIHRSTIVNLDRIEGIDQDWQGEYQVHLRGQVALRVGRTYRKRLMG
jgi:two-component system LytT family response regulator